jgi:hypothetical protein
MRELYFSQLCKVKQLPKGFESSAEKSRNETAGYLRTGYELTWVTVPGYDDN